MNINNNIGFIGLGIMGKPMAKNLINAGYNLIVYNRSKPSIDELVSYGATGALSCMEVAKKSDIIITMLPNSPDVLEVLTKPEGILAGARKGSLVVDMSSIAPSAAEQSASLCSQKGIGFIDAPVSGGEQGAIDATLSIMAGGKAEDLEKCYPVLKTLGKNIVHTGKVGSGSMTKLANQIMVALNIAAMGEAMTLGAKLGLDCEVMYNAVKGGLAQSAVLDGKINKLLSGDYSPGFYLDLHIKDLQNVLNTCGENQVSLPLTEKIMKIMKEQSMNGYGKEDHSTIVRYYENKLGVSIKDTKK